ncbi:hypothetical protein NEISICOT_01802 [Neisseria sicca ATCC 29256]|uniref:Uncharacterized protein n=1 Tax=Neisseria sicca ATCC 29256 TaxID=547045 RepID=C6M5K3_NEISI|nr:hypothetical protein NEISICOT_01802 [Neisseria sicca ATCC 29256]
MRFVFRICCIFALRAVSVLSKQCHPLLQVLRWIRGNLRIKVV